MRDQSSGSTHPVFTGWRGIALGLFAAVCVLFSIDAQIETAMNNGVLAPGIMGRYGGQPSIERNLPPGFVRLHYLAPTGGYRHVGMVPEDAVRFDQPYMTNRTPLAGERFDVSILHQGRIRRAVLTTTPADMVYSNSSLLFSGTLAAISGAVLLAFSILLFVRGWGRLAPVVLGFALIGYGIEISVSYWARSPIAASVDLILSGTLNALVMLLTTFVLLLYNDAVGAVTKSWWRANLIYLACGYAIILGVVWSMYHSIWTPFVNQDFSLWSLVTVVGQLMAIYWTFRGWRSQKAAASNRFGTVLIAFGIALVAQLIPVIYQLVLRLPGPYDRSLATDLHAILINVVVPGLLVYAVLRHRVVDIGFAINRTLVYGAVSFVLLASFGVIEWAAEHLLPREMVEKSTWLDGAIAVAVFLTFHRVRDTVEEWVQRLFFHRWRENEAQLRRFVGAAGHFEDEAALARALVAELARFTGTTGIALFRAERDGSFTMAAGELAGAPKTLPDTDLAFAVMRAERAPVELATTLSTLPGALALPLIDHGTLTGFVLLDERSGGAGYRPDELELLGWATRQVALDFQALRLRLVEQEGRLQAAEINRMVALIGARLTTEAG